MTRAPPARSPRLLLVATLLAGFVIIAGGVLSWAMLDGPGHSLFSSQIGGPFRLVDQDGKTVTDRDLRGKWLLVYFGYTHCPDACPTALNNIALALRALGKRRDEIRPVFITVDPQRDTAAVLKNYVASFDAPILALTGSPAAIAQAAHAYRVYYAKHPLPGGDYEMDHSSIIYVMNPQGTNAAILTHLNSAKRIADELKRLIPR